VTDTRDDRPLVLRSSDDGVLTLTLNREERFNPLSSAMIAALDAEFEAAACDASTRVVVLAAAGKGFSAGHDLKEMRAHAHDKSWQSELFDACSRMMVRITALPQPMIARVQGIATAAGCQLVSMCDLAVAVDTATFAMPGVNIGVFCSTPAVGVARNIGRKRTALAWGLVNRVVAADALDATIAHFTGLIKARSAATIRLGKEAFYAQVEQPIAGAYAVTSEAMACNMLLDDASEGIDAFLGKRAPAWRGR
jgi:enoyl-CoA hydratase/carnithine racemase